MIFVRADGNKEIGTGHLMRCISIMEQATDKKQIMFLVADEDGKQIVNSKGFSCKVLNTNYRDMESELLILSKLIKQSDVSMILVDSYQITPFYLEELSKIGKVTLMEDVLDETFNVNKIINYNIYADQIQYQNKYQSNGLSNVNFYTGVEFVPLRDEFRISNYEVRKEIRDVFISAGGADPFNYAGKLLELLLRKEHSKEYVYHVISGVFNINREFLKSIDDKYDNVIIYENISNISDVMKRCDVAISAAGSTMYELASIGVPIITYAFADNQDMIAETFDEKKMALSAGDSSCKMSIKLDNIVRYLNLLASSYDSRVKMNKILRTNIDGTGSMVLFKILAENEDVNE
jgi:UDP-2,4-diacetamido-2,4,6-trideoxy-beta-L-altropyranose hydrolase